MVIGGSELIGLLFKAFLIVLLSGIILIAFVPLRIKSLISVLTVFLIAVFTSILAIMAFSADGIEYIVDGGNFFGSIPLRIDTLSAWFILLIRLRISQEFNCRIPVYRFSLDSLSDLSFLDAAGWHSSA